MYLPSRQRHSTAHPSSFTLCFCMCMPLPGVPAATQGGDRDVRGLNICSTNTCTGTGTDSTYVCTHLFHPTPTPPSWRGGPAMQRKIGCSHSGGEDGAHAREKERERWICRCKLIALVLYIHIYHAHIVKCANVQMYGSEVIDLVNELMAKDEKIGICCLFFFYS